MAEARSGPVDPSTLARLDAVPGSLGRVSLVAAVTLGIAAYVSVRTWLASRSTAGVTDLDSKGISKYGFRTRSKASSASVPRSNGGAVGGASGSGEGLGSGASGERGGGAGASPSERPQLPPRNYFTIRAALHVKRHNAKLMEWYDEQLGMQLPFSPQFFELKQEERQAPLILLTFRTLRDTTHRMAVTIEELYAPQTAQTYCEASLSRIADCAKMIATASVHLEGKDHPTAEYCYVDEEEKTNFVLSAFVTHERLAVTLQYVAPARVRNVVPTAFQDLLRFLTFTSPAPSPSYLLVSEPRLGLGYHLPLDFLVHEGLAESDGVEDRLFTSVSSNSNSDNGGAGRPPQQLPLREPQLTRGLGSGSSNTRKSPWTSSGAAYDTTSREEEWVVPYATAMSRGGRRMGLITSYEPSMVPASVASGSGSLFVGDLSANAAPAVGSGNGGGVPYVWRPYLEEQVQKAMRQLGFVWGSSHRGSSHAGATPVSLPPRVIFQSPDPSDLSAYRGAGGSPLLVESYPLSVSLNGNFGTGDDGREDEGSAVNVTVFSLFREVRLDVNSSYVTLVPDALEGFTAEGGSSGGGGGGGGVNRSSGGAERARSAAGNSSSSPATVRAYWSAFYVPVGTACVSFHFVASAQRHSSTDFVSFCAGVMNSISFGNHYGQAVSVLYCNTRHDVLPFRLSLPPTGMSAIDEPMLSDPLCIVQTIYGVEKVVITVRVFPLFTSTTGANVVQGSGELEGATEAKQQTPTPGTPSIALGNGGRQPSPNHQPHQRHPSDKPFVLSLKERGGTRQRSAVRQLQFMIRYYLSQFPGGVRLVSYSRTSVNVMPALQLCFQPLWYGHAESASDSMNNWEDFVGGGSASSQGTSDWTSVRDTLLEEEVGQLNPFAQYFPPPPPPPSYLWGTQQQGNASLSPPLLSPATPAASVKTVTPTSGGRSTAAEAGKEEAYFYAHATGGDSPCSREELDNPLRVAIAVCCEGNAFLFQTSASEYTLGAAQQAVRTMATHLTSIPRGS